MLTDGEVRLGACCAAESVSPVHPGADWLPAPKAGIPLDRHHWVAQPCGAAPVRSHGSNE